MKNQSHSDYKNALYTKIEQRICDMEHPEYSFAKRFGKRDYLLVGIIVIIGIFFLVLGAYL